MKSLNIDPHEKRGFHCILWWIICYVKFTHHFLKIDKAIKVGFVAIMSKRKIYNEKFQVSLNIYSEYMDTVKPVYSNTYTGKPSLCWNTQGFWLHSLKHIENVRMEINVRLQWNGLRCMMSNSTNFRFTYKSSLWGVSSTMFDGKSVKIIYINLSWEGAWMGWWEVLV